MTCRQSLDQRHIVFERRSRPLRRLGQIVPSTQRQRVLREWFAQERLGFFSAENTALQFQAAYRIDRKLCEIIGVDRAEATLGIDVKANGFEHGVVKKRPQERKREVLVQVV